MFSCLTPCDCSARCDPGFSARTTLPISQAFRLNSWSHSHFVTYKVGTNAECQQCATGEEASRPSNAPNVAMLLIQLSDPTVCTGVPGRATAAD